MSIIFQKLIEQSEFFLTKLNGVGVESSEDHGFSWPNYVYTSDKFRRAHLDVVDARETKKLYMMHLCVFPHTHDDSPIYGFDLIAGPNKVTGAFHDFSPTLDKNHELCRWFTDRVSGLEWSKKRQLPEWARNIFSDCMIAAGNINTESELDKILYIARDTLVHYLDNVGSKKDVDATQSQNYYCENQRKNPHTPRVMESLGLDSADVSRFISDCLFPSL